MAENLVSVCVRLTGSQVAMAGPIEAGRWRLSRLRRRGKGRAVRNPMLSMLDLDSNLVQWWVLRHGHYFFARFAYRVTRG